MERKTLIKGCLMASVLSLCISSAFAASTAVLKVKGTLVTVGCVPTLSNGGVADFGSINISDLSKTEGNVIGLRDLSMNIACSSPTKVGWTLSDDRRDSSVRTSLDAATVPANVLFGVGKTTGGVNIGNYRINMTGFPYKADSVIVGMISKSVVAGTWSLHGNSASNPLAGGNSKIYTVASVGTVAPLAFTNANIPLRTELMIQDATKLALTDNTPIDGQATISLVYL